MRWAVVQMNQSFISKRTLLLTLRVFIIWDFKQISMVARNMHYSTFHNALTLRATVSGLVPCAGKQYLLKGMAIFCQALPDHPTQPGPPASTGTKQNSRSPSKQEIFTQWLCKQQQALPPAYVHSLIFLFSLYTCRYTCTKSLCIQSWLRVVAQSCG